MFEHDSKQDPEMFEDQDMLALQLQNMIEEGGRLAVGLTTLYVEHSTTHPRIEDLVGEQTEHLVEQQAA
jgi:hypothetical protein